MFRPLYDYVMVKEIQQDRTIDGVLMPDVAREDMKFGKVIATGDGRPLDSYPDGYQIYFRPGTNIRKPPTMPLEVKSGDLVAFGPHAGMRISLAGEEFLLMREAEIKGVIEKDDSGTGKPENVA